MTGEPRTTALRCLALLAEHHGLYVAAGRLRGETAQIEPDDATLLRLARDAGFEAKLRQRTWRSLPNLEERRPLIGRLDNGNSVVIAGVARGAGDEQVAIFDPLASPSPGLRLARDVFEKAWSGRVLELAPPPTAADADGSFGLGWFMRLGRSEIGAFRDALIAAAALHLLGLVVPLFFQVVADKVIPHQSTNTLLVLGAGVAIALLFDALLTYLRASLLVHAAAKIDIRVAARTFRRLISLPVTFFEASAAGVLARHMQQSGRIRQFITGRLLFTLLDLLVLIVFVPLLFFYSSLIGTLVLATAVVIALIAAALLGPFRRKLETLYKAEAGRQAALVETLHGVIALKALALEPSRTEEWDRRSAECVRLEAEVSRISWLARTLSGFFEKAGVVLLIAVGALLVFEGQMTIGALIAVQMIAGRVVSPLVQAVGLIHEFQETGMAVRMLGEIMNRRPESDRDFPGLRPAILGGLAFERVSFRYAQDAPPALDDVSFTIEPGSFVGVVGRSGSGKSTLVRLLLGLHRPQHGLIRLDGRDLREVDLAHLRANLGVVLQDNFLLRGTIRDNVALARADAGFAEIVRAGEMAGATEFIERLPKGWETEVEENGANLSGGQRQRLAVARAILRDPRIMIFDEATSALDPETEAMLQDNLPMIARERTLVVVSHRLSFLRNADQILVLDSGRLIDAGTHDVLVVRCDLYRRLWHQQTRHLRPEPRPTAL
ncbi:MAG: peptidase domain-containing ABC transporter [Alphaproteobacteria bacterium]|nr:peptidase domain-containing ABC transporter [Alphaproteobacteria bacterium]